MKELEMLYEGKAKKVFATENPDQVIVDTRMMRRHSTVRKKVRFSEKALLITK